MSTEILRIEDDAGGRITADDDGDPPRALIFDTRNDDPAAPATALLFEGGVRSLVDALTAWLDAPRLAARASAEVVEADHADHLELVKTTAGEWGVRAIEAAFDDAGNVTGNVRRALIWYAGDDAERQARRWYAAERDRESCECGAEVDPDDDGVANTEDGWLCADCAAVAHAEWLASDVACTGGFVAKDADGKPCGWRGKGADAAMVGGVSTRRECPTCGGGVELVEESAEAATP